MFMPNFLPEIFQGHPKFTFGGYLLRTAGGLDRLRNSDLVVKKMLSFLPQTVCSKFRNTGKINPFVFDREGANMSLKMREKINLHFRN